MFGLGPTELIIIAVIILLLFGAKRIPEIGKGLGGAIREFRDIKKEVGSDKAEKGDSGSDAAVEEKEEPKSVEAQVGEKLMDQVPGVKGVMDAKKKAEKLKNLFD
ncbi:MAG: twin-arginine translocase TatA/TatE family subunit [Desulfobacterales bacterium]